MSSINVSIIVVSYNCSDVIESNINSYLGINNVEYILIDNFSSDNTIELANRFSDRIEIIANKNNIGFTKACNQGIERAKGKYIFLLNPDAELTSNTVEVLSAKLNNNELIGAVAPNLFYPNGEFQNYTRRFPSVLGLFVESFVPMKFWNKFNVYKRYTCQDVDFTLEQEVEQPAGASLMFRNEFMLDENYFIYGSDVDLCKQIIDRGYKIVQTPETKVIHHQSKGGTDNKDLRIYLDADNYYGMKYYFKKNNMNIKYILYSILFFFGLLLSVFVGLFNGSFSKKINRLSLFVSNSNFTKIFKKN